MDILTLSVASALPFLILAIIYFYFGRESRRFSVVLWGAGWLFYALCLLAMAGEPTDRGPWLRFAALLMAETSSLLLWAGAYALSRRSLPWHFFLFGLLALLGALAVFFPWTGIVSRLPALAVMLFFDGAAIFVLARYSLVAERRRLHRTVSVAYLVWLVTKVIHFLDPRLAFAIPWIVLVNGSALLLCLSLIAFDLIDTERSARRRAERLAALAALTRAADRRMSPRDLLLAAVEEVERLLEGSSGIGALLIAGPDQPAQVVTRQSMCLLGEDCCLWETYPCAEAVSKGRVLCLDRASLPAGCGGRLVIPLQAGEQTLGIICAQIDPDRVLSRGELRTFEILSRQVGQALENARLLQEMSEKIERLQALTEASRRMSAELDLEKALEGIVTVGMSIVGADRAAVYLYDAERDRATVSYACGLSQDYLDFLVNTFRDVPGYRVLEGLEAIWVRDTLSDLDDSPLREAIMKEGFRSYVVLPLVYLQQVRGALVFYHNDVRDYNPADLELCQALAGQAAAVLENAMLYRQTQRRLEELAALHEIDLHMLAALELDPLLKIIVEQMVRILGVSTLYIGLYDERADVLDLRAVLDQGVFQPPVRVSVSGEESLSGWVVRHGEPLWIDDVEKELPALPVRPLRIGGETRSLGILPLVVKGAVRGVLSVQSYEPYAFTASDRQLVTEIATQAAIAIENARLYQAERQARQVSETLLGVASAVNSTLELKEVLREVALRAAGACEASRCTIFLLDPSGEALEPIMSQFASGRPDPELWRQLRQASAPLRVEDIPEAVQVIRSRKPLYVPDVRASTLPPQWIEPFGVGSVLLVPLISGGERVIGAMALDRVNRGHHFSMEQITLATTIAGQAAVAIERARLYEETSRRLAQTQVLREVMLAAASTLDFERVLLRTIETLHAAMRIEYISFAMPDEEGEGLRFYPTQIGFPPRIQEVRLPLEGSICGLVYRTGQPFLSRDVSQVPFYYEGDSRVRSELAVPVRVGGRVIGVLDLESRRSNAFDEEDLDLYMALAGQLGVALENARLYEETARRLAETQILREISQAAASTLDFDQVLARTLDALQRTLGAEYINLMLPDENEQVMRPHRATLGFRDVLEGWESPIDHCITGRVYRTGQAALVADVNQDPDYAVGAEDVRSELAVPVRVGGQVVAVLNIESRRPNAFDEDDLAFYMTVAGQLGVALENSRLYQREQQRRLEAEKLSHQLEEQSAQLTRALQELQEFDRLRNEMVQNVGHELRTPLTLIQGYTELLMSGDMGPLEPAQRNALEVIYERTVSLSRLLRNLVALRSLQREQLSIRPLLLHQVVAYAVDIYRRASERAGIQLLFDVADHAARIEGDEEHLRLVFLQLLDNAIKFSPDGGDVVVRVWSDEEQVYASVQDHGIGIAPEHIGRIFERFYQVDGSTTRRYGGVGIGLAVVWEIVEMHGGTVDVQSEPGEGSTFTVTLPRMKG